MPRIQTVRGAILPADLGPTDCHEHLICSPAGRLAAADPDLVLDDEDKAAEELRRFKESGGASLVEFSTADYGRDVLALRSLSEATGVHIICTTGCHKAEFSSQLIEATPRDRLLARFVAEIEEGIDGTGIKAGVVKAATSLNQIFPTEETALRLAALVHRATGAPIVTHTTAGSMALEQLEVLRSEGVAAENVILGHLDRRLDWEYHLQIARTGAFMAFDQISKEKYYPDQLRVDFIRDLIEAGYEKQILLGCDLGRKSYFTSYGGGPGLTYLFSRFVPWMVQRGIPEKSVEQIILHNPADAFQFRW